MKTFEIIYIATGFHYICFFDWFIKSLEKFCTDTAYKNVKLLTDITDFDIEQYNTLKNIHIELYYIPHMPWPSVTLFKLHFINNFVNDNYDLMFYFNANAMTKPMLEIPNELLDNNCDFYFYTPKDDPGRFKNWGTQDNPYAKNLPYVQGTVFAGRKKGMQHCCNYIMNHINNLLLNFTIEEKHDESAMNHYLVHLTETNEINYNVLKLSEIIDFLSWETHKIIYNNEEHEVCHINGLFKENNKDFDNYPTCKPIFIK